MARNINSVREAELSAALHGAFIASPMFLSAFLQNIGVPHPEDVDHIESSLEYVTADTGSRIDIYLWRDDPPLVVGIEVKRSEGGIRESQIRDYLSQMKITQQDGRLQRRRDAPRNAKLVVITGGTESPEEIEHVKIASSGTLESYIQWISWYRIVDILDEVIAGENLRSLTYLSNKLSDLGYVAINASLPTLKTYQQVLSNILAIVNDDSIKSELEVLATTLNRVEYEMGKLNYGVTIQLTKAKTGRKLTVKRQRRINLKSFNLFGGKIFTIGRAFQPNTVIQRFQQPPQQPKSQEAGVGIAYSIPSRSWVAFILPEKGYPLPAGFIEEFSSSNRSPLDQKLEGFAGWILKGDQRRPLVAAKFLKRVWEAYESSWTNDVG